MRRQHSYNMALNLFLSDELLRVPGSIIRKRMDGSGGAIQHQVEFS